MYIRSKSKCPLPSQDSNARLSSWPATGQRIASLHAFSFKVLIVYGALTARLMFAFRMPAYGLHVAQRKAQSATCASRYVSWMPDASPILKYGDGTPGSCGPDRAGYPTMPLFAQDNPGPGLLRVNQLEVGLFQSFVFVYSCAGYCRAIVLESTVDI